MSNNFALMLRVRGEISTEELNAALRQVRVRHPALAASDGAQAFPIFVRADCGDADWIAAAAAELLKPFPDGHGPFARFSLLQRPGGCDLLATFNHSVCEGMSGVYVLRDLLQALADPQATLVPAPLPPRINELIPAAALANRGLRRRVDSAVAGLRARVLLEKLRRRLAPRKTAGPQSPVELPADREDVTLLPARLTATQTAALLARCKNERVSVHAAVCAAWLKAQTEMSGARFGIVSSPVNLRGRLSQPVGETAGLFLATVETRLACPPGRDLWELARAFKQAFSRDTREEALFFKPLLYGKVFSQLSPADRGIAAGLLFNSPVAYDFSITNLGRLALPEHSGGLQAEAFYGPLVNSSEYERTVGVSTLAGQMSVSYLFRRSRTDPVQAGALLTRALGLLTSD